jgi:hypothetical protein
MNFRTPETPLQASDCAPTLVRVTLELDDQIHFLSRGAGGNVRVISIP